MSGPEAQDLVADHEIVARFVKFSGWLRGNQTVKPDAFYPPPDLNLSVTRHQGWSDGQLWEVGLAVAKTDGRRLLGRADIGASAIRSSEPGMNVLAAPVPGNPNHAHIVGWSAGAKAAHKLTAQKLAAAAAFVAPPAEL